MMIDLIDSGIGLSKLGIDSGGLARVAAGVCCCLRQVETDVWYPGTLVRLHHQLDFSCD